MKKKAIVLLFSILCSTLLLAQKVLPVMNINWPVFIGKQNLVWEEMLLQGSERAYTVDTIINPSFPILNKNVDLFVWGGQSNAQGWKGDGSFYPVDSNHLDQYIGLNYTFVGNTSSSGNWIYMQPQIGRFPKGHFGPEVSFGRKLKESGANPAIFKFTRGSSSIYNFWKTPGSGGEYDSLIVYLYKAIQVLEQKGYHVTIRGLVWIQGESDAENITMANAYKASLESMIHDFKTRVAKNKLLPVILGVDEQHMWVVKNPVIVEAQKNAAASLPNVQFTSMIGLPKDDATHLTPAGLVMHGIRIYDAYIRMVNNLQK